MGHTYPQWTCISISFFLVKQVHLSIEDPMSDQDFISHQTQKRTDAVQFSENEEIGANGRRVVEFWAL